MKNRLLLITALIGAALVLLPSPTYASVSVELFKPKSPTNQNTLKLSFVALDTEDNDVTVKCFKKSPGEAVPTQFDTDKVLTDGGNSGYCDVTSSIINNSGTYFFYVTAFNGTETKTSPTVSVDYNTSGPGTPDSYSKEKINSCDYRIKFKTADDGGKTVKVELFRSDTKTISIDSGGRVVTLSIGSNQEGQIVNSVPDCQKEYFYVLRAVDASDNVSGIVGDGYTKVITETSTTTATQTTTTTPGALLSTSSQVTQPGDVTTPGSDSEDEATADGTPEEITVSPSPEVLGSQTSTSKLYKWLIIPLLLIAGYFIMRSYKKIA